MSGADASNLHLAWSRLLFSALARAGVRDVVVSPGSRSTPLVLACAREHALRTRVLVDERSAAFYALGQARVTGRPSVLVCTSGTAGAHYLPAVIEAAQSFVPLVVITADRPWEAYDAAAPQTIDQVKLFGSHVRHYAELGLPDADLVALRAVGRIAAQLVHRATSPVPGPVHLDARFRKPLEPVDVKGPEPWQAEVDALLAAGGPHTFDARATATPVDPRAVSFVADAIVEGRDGWIVCGPWVGAVPDAARWAARVATLAERTGFAILAESTSHARAGEGAHCAAFDALLRDAGTRRALGGAPSVLLELGAPPTSNGYAQMLASRDATRSTRVVVAPHGWHDPAGDATAMVLADPVAFVDTLSDELTRRRHRPARTALEATARMRAFDALAWRAVHDEIAEAAGALTEGEIAAEVMAATQGRRLLAIGNSSPVRDVDTFAPPARDAVTVLHQRGASGIDGLVAGASGARSVVGGGAVTLLLGDVSLLHDLGSLVVAAESSEPLVLVVVQNQGGRIFEALPIARRNETHDLLEPFFLTPRAVDLSHAAAAFGVAYCRVSSRSELAAALASAQSTPRCTLIEAVVPPTDGAARRTRVFASVARAVRGALA